MSSPFMFSLIQIRSIDKFTLFGFKVNHKDLTILSHQKYPKTVIRDYFEGIEVTVVDLGVEKKRGCSAIYPLYIDLLVDLDEVVVHRFDINHF